MKYKAFHEFPLVNIYNGRSLNLPSYEMSHNTKPMIWLATFKLEIELPKVHRLSLLETTHWQFGHYEKNADDFANKNAIEDRQIVFPKA